MNFSKSGVGGSIGVKGARLTMTPRGTTYVTVGSHGCYYRETVSNSGRRPVSPNAPVPPQPRNTSDADRITSADSQDLVDSSSEQFVQRLNRCANMSNPAYLFYVAAAISIIVLLMIPPAPSMPNLPDVTTPYSAERYINAVDEYSAMTSRFGEPDSIAYAEADPLIPTLVGTASYISAHVDVILVPNGCASSYGEIARLLARRPTKAYPSDPE